MLALYRSLLRLYPAAYFREFGGEMTLVFRHAQADTREKTLTARLSFYCRELTGLLVGAVRHRFGGPGDGSGMRRFDMRPEFRFPRSTVVLMCVILAGVVLAIDKAKTIVNVRQGLPPETTAVWNSLLWWLLSPLPVLAAVAAGWGILFALRRTGVHRLEKLETWPDQP